MKTNNDTHSSEKAFSFKLKRSVIAMSGVMLGWAAIGSAAQEYTEKVL